MTPSRPKQRWPLLGAALALRQQLRRFGTPVVRRRVGVVLNIFQIALFSALLYQNRATLPALARIFTVPIITACLLLYLASLLIQFWIWHGLMDYRRGETRRALDEYIRTIFMGRLPGGLWKFVGRVTVYRAPRLSGRAILIINLVEIVVALLSNGLVVLLVAPRPWYVVAGGLAAVAVAIAGTAGWLAHELPGGRLATLLPRCVGWVLGFAVAWVCGGVIMHLVVAPFGGNLRFADTLLYWCIAGAAGVILQVLPLSILIRDATVAGMLQTTLPLGTAIVAALAVRLTMAACELITGWALLAVARLAPPPPQVPVGE